MSMLAERRRKTKWVINPTKKPIWTTDSEGIKLGKQLMEKMGWSAGKGLGAKEQGIQEPLKVSYKNDTKGMGFKGNDEDWIEHQDEFNSLLSQLSSSDPSKTAELDKNEIKSLEEKSKHSRARVHYQKFTRGKDLSRYSETDLACILGINHNKKRKNSVEEKNPVEEKTDNSYETSFGVTTINSGSISDYFKKKWTMGKSKDNNSSNTIDEITESTSNTNEDCMITPEHKKSKKRKHDEINGDVPNDTTNQTQEEVQSSEVVEEVKKNRKSKKQKVNEVDSENLKVPENETVEITEEIDNVCDLEGDKESKKHKKSKKKKKEDISAESETVVKDNADNSNQTEGINQDNQIEAGVENVSRDNNLSLEDKKLESKDTDENFTRKRKKEKKKDKTKELDTLEDNLEPLQGELEHKIKKKKKKDKEKKEKDHDTQSEVKEVTVENCSQSQSISNNYENIQNAVDLESEKPKKEKRRKEKHKLDQSKLENEEDLKTNCVSVEVESKSKSKKRKEKLVNQSLPEIEWEQDTKTKNLLEEVEPIVKEKKKKGKNKTDKSKLESEEQETEAKSTCEESEVKQKKKKDKHKSDHPTLEDVTENKSVPEQIEPEAKETSKKDKLSERKKSKHKRDSEGVDKSKENVAETNDDVNTIRQQGEGLEKAEIDTTQKEDCKKLAKGNKSKQEEGKTDDSGRIFSHKVELFKKKKKGLSFLGAIPKKSPNNRVMGLVFGAQFEKFKGANIENLVGYGMRNKIQSKDDG